MESVPTFSPPDLAPLTIHVLNTSSAEDTGVEKSVKLLQEALVALVNALQTHFESMENVNAQQPVSRGPSLEAGGTARTTRLEGASTSLYDITAEVVQLSQQAEKTLPRLSALEEQSRDSLEMIRKLISAGEKSEADIQRNQQDLVALADRSCNLEKHVETVFPPLQSDLININAALQLGEQKTVVDPPPLVEVPWRTPLNHRITRVEEEISTLQSKMKAWSQGCEDLMLKTQRERAADEVDLSKAQDANSISFQRHSPKQREGVSGTGARGWKDGSFVECDLGMVLHYFLSTLSEFSTTEETIRQWEVVHQLIETKIEHTVREYIDVKLSDAMRDPERKEHALRIIHSLSPDAAYRNILTQLDFKVDKQVFHTLSARVFEQLDGIAKLSSLQGHAINDLNSGLQRPSRSTSRHSLSELTTAHPVKSIHHTSVSREAFKQAHLRLPKPPHPPHAPSTPVAPSRPGALASASPASRHTASTPRSSVTWAPETLGPSESTSATSSYFVRRRQRPVSAKT